MKKILFQYGVILMCFVVYSSKGIKQGITGTIRAKHGNNMPSPDRKQSVGKPVKTIVYVYQLVNREQAQGDGTYFTNIQTKLVAKSQSNADGYFAITLPTGEYSVFVEDNGQLYANNFDGKGSINPVKVKKDSVTVNDITISSNAVY